MVANGGFVVQAPAFAGGDTGALLRAVKSVFSTYLLVQMFVVCAVAFVWAGAVLFAFSEALIIAFAVAIAAITIWLSIVLFRRVWAVEKSLDLSGDLTPASF